MKINQELLEKLCQLTALNLSLQEKQALKLHLEEALSHFQKISSVDTQGIPALSNPLEQKMKLREDKAQDFSEKKQMLEGAPERQGNLIKVPSTV